MFLVVFRSRLRFPLKRIFGKSRRFALGSFFLGVWEESSTSSQTNWAVLSLVFSRRCDIHHLIIVVYIFHFSFLYTEVWRGVDSFNIYEKIWIHAPDLDYPFPRIPNTESIARQLETSFSEFPGLKDCRRCFWKWAVRFQNVFFKNHSWRETFPQRTGGFVTLNLSPISRHAFSMAPAVRSIKRKDAINWPRMSTTFWAVLLLTALLIVYCGESAVCAMHLRYVCEDV